MKHLQVLSKELGMNREATLYQKMGNNEVRCGLCSHRCTIPDGKSGICGVRNNQGGSLFTLVFGKVIASHIDPIEKKPLYHFYPGSSSFSIATVGCNFKCRFCQNSDISQMPIDQKGKIMGQTVSPEEIVLHAEQSGCKSISYTYTEPTVYFEFAYETAKLAHEKGIKNVFVTNGYMTPESIKMISPFLDAANVDVKAFSDGFYRKFCGASLEPVEETLSLMKYSGIWVEITTLLIPGHNDDRKELENLARYIVSVLGPEVPWHISRFHPSYCLTDIPPTSIGALVTAREIGIQAGLKYVYTGNVPGHEGENTYCYHCGHSLIERWGFHIGNNRINYGQCEKCGTKIDGVGL